MEISSRMKLVTQSLPGIAVQRSRLYCPQLHRLCKARSHPGCWNLRRLPPAQLWTPTWARISEKTQPTSLDLLSETCWNLSDMRLCTTASVPYRQLEFYMTVTSGIEKSPSQATGFLVVAYFNFRSHRRMCPTAKEARRSTRKLGKWITMNTKRGSAKCMRQF